MKQLEIRFPGEHSGKSAFRTLCTFTGFVTLWILIYYLVGAIFAWGVVKYSKKNTRKVFSDDLDELAKEAAKKKPITMDQLDHMCDPVVVGSEEIDYDSEVDEFIAQKKEEGAGFSRCPSRCPGQVS